MESLHAQVATEHASRYLQQLCKHWSHRFEVAFDAARGTVHLNGAVCRFQAEPQCLAMTLDGEQDLVRISGVVTEHLKRFAFKEDLVVNWA